MQKSDIADKLLALLIEETDKTADEIKSALLWQDLDMDSLLTMEVILKVEDMFNINVDEKEVEFIKNYNDLLKYLEKTI